MFFTDVFIKRPVFAASLSLLLLVMGLIAYESLTLRQFPKMEANVISIKTGYSGASASTVESFVTTRIENAIAGVDDIDYITSSSSDGKSEVTINLVLNADINSAIEDVNSDVSSVKKKLPDAIDDPDITKVDPDAMPMMIIGFSSDARSSEEVTDYLNRVIVPQLTTISGVGSADVMGERTYAMRLWLDPDKMAALGVTADDVQDALDDNNIQAQPGDIDRKDQILTINAQTDVSTAKEFAALVVKTNDGKLVQMRDIGRVELGAEDYDTSHYMNGKSGVGLSITVKSSANPLEVSRKIKATLNNLKKQMPSDYKMSFERDSSVYIENSVQEVVHTILEAALFVIIVIYCFIGSLRSVFIPIVTIPLSLVGAFAFMFAMGYTINTLTLLAFVLAIGMVVDDAIVVLENIHRHIEQGMSPKEAAITGAREISFAVIAMTFTLSAVFAPIGFTSGFTSILFKEFAFTLAGTVVISGVIALTLSPMMCSKVMRESGQETGFSLKVNRTFNRLMHRYQDFLTTVLEQRAVVLTVLIGVILLGIIFFIPMKMQSTLAPTEDQGVVIGMARAPTAASLAYTERYTDMMQPIFKSVPERTQYTIINGHPGGQNHAMMFLGLKDWSQRSRSAMEIQQELTQKAESIPGLSIMFFSPGSLPASHSMYPVEFVVKTTGSYAELNSVTQKLVKALEKNRGFLKVQPDLHINKPELNIKINREKARSLGVSMSDINTALNIALGEPDVSTFDMDGDTYDVITQVESKFRNDPKQLDNLTVATESGDLIPLSNVITVSDIVSPSSLNHFQQQRAATIDVVLSNGYSEQEAIDYFEQVASDLLPEDMSYDFSGDTREYVQSGSSMAKIFIFALLFIYLILSAQFESFIDPLIVLFTVPLSLVGALVTLYFAGGSLNIYTEIGLVTLVGLISKHGILIVEFANQLKRQGKCTKAAVIEAASIRLRPILMTTAAMVLGALPLVLASGAGAVARSQMGWTIVGGMTFGTMLTLFVIPTIYLLLSENS